MLLHLSVLQGVPKRPALERFGHLREALEYDDILQLYGPLVGQVAGPSLQAGSQTMNLQAKP